MLGNWRMVAKLGEIVILFLGEILKRRKRILLTLVCSINLAIIY